MPPFNAQNQYFTNRCLDRKLSFMKFLQEIIFPNLLKFWSQAYWNREEKIWLFRSIFSVSENIFLPLPVLALPFFDYALCSSDEVTNDEKTENPYLPRRLDKLFLLTFSQKLSYNYDNHFMRMFHVHAKT